MENELINVVENQKGDITVLKIKGKLDSLLAPSLEKKIFTYLNEGHTKLILDFSDITYINSAGLRMLLSIKKQIRSFQGALIVCSLRSEVLEMLKICGFDHVLEIAANEEEALRRL